MEQNNTDLNPDALPDLYAACRQILVVAKTRWRALPADSYEKKCIRDIEKAVEKSQRKTD